MKRLLFQVAAAILGIWLAVKFITGVEFIGEARYLFFAGIILGLLNFFIKPTLKIITLPLRILTLGLFSLVINMAMIWLIDLIFPELIILGIIPLFWTSIIVWLISWLLPKIISTKKL